MVISKKTFAALAAALITSFASATTCNVVLPYSASGPATEYTRIMQKNNPDVGQQLQYAPGAFAVPGISFLEKNKDWMMNASPMMFSTKNPQKNPKVELISIPILYGQLGISNKDVTFHDLLTKPLMVAYPIVGGSQHLIALQLQKANPKLTLVPTGSLPKGLQLVVNKEVDVFIMTSHSVRQHVNEFHLRTVFELPKNKKAVTIEGVRLDNFGMFAVFAHADASVSEKENIRKCVRGFMSSPTWVSDLAAVEAAPSTFTKAEQEKYLADFIKALEDNGL